MAKFLRTSKPGSGGSGLGWWLATVLMVICVRTSQACTTLVAGRLATADGSVMAAHSNDGNHDVAGNLERVPAVDWAIPSTRAVSRGAIPQVAHTFAYFTKVGGYASTNEHQVGLAESTCVAVFEGNASIAMLNIVDLSAIGLERGRSARETVLLMGNLAEKFGYYDAGESLFVADYEEAYVFHVLPDDTGRSAVWAAQRVPDDHVGVVANGFTIRNIDFSDTENYLFSGNLRSVAKRARNWSEGEVFDFTRLFAGPEAGHKYATGRRMWVAFRLLAPDAAEGLSPYYAEYVSSAPYPATLPSKNVTLDLMKATMRNYYQDTEFDMRRGMAAGSFGTPDRVPPGEGSKEVQGNWERTIATSKTILSYVLVLRKWLPSPVGGILWLAMHAAHTSVYLPLPLGLLSSAGLSVPLPIGYTNTSLTSVDRGVSVFQASRWVFNAAQHRFDAAIEEISEAQRHWESGGLKLVDELTEAYIKDHLPLDKLADQIFDHARSAVSAWWALSDDIVQRFGDTCKLGYPAWWLRDVGYPNGPPPSPPVPPYPETSSDSEVPRSSGKFEGNSEEKFPNFQSSEGTSRGSLEQFQAKPAPKGLEVASEDLRI